MVDGTSVVGSINVGTGPQFGTFDSDNGYVYMPNFNTSNVSVLSGLTVVVSIHVGKNPWSAEYDSADRLGCTSRIQAPAM